MKPSFSKRKTLWKKKALAFFPLLVYLTSNTRTQQIANFLLDAVTLLLGTILPYVACARLAYS